MAHPSVRPVALNDEALKEPSHTAYREQNHLFEINRGFYGMQK